MVHSYLFWRLGEPRRPSLEFGHPAPAGPEAAETLALPWFGKSRFVTLSSDWGQRVPNFERFQGFRLFIC